MDATAEIDTAGAEAVEAPLEAAERDYEAEARQHGWQPPEEFKGDKSKCVDAKTFVERADTFMPFIKKDRDDWKRKFSELQRTVKQYAKHADKVDERAYTRALTDLQTKHDEAVETGDVAAARAAVREIGEINAEIAAKPKDDEPEFDPVAARKELNDWVEENDWYVLDDGKRRYADMQAETMGPARDWPEGNGAWLAELGKRVDRKFAAKPVSPTNGGGNRSAPGLAGKSYNDLPAQAKAACDKFHRAGIFGDPSKVSLADARQKYVADYDFGA